MIACGWGADAIIPRLDTNFPQSRYFWPQGIVTRMKGERRTEVDVCRLFASVT